jgi:hypothetical protein
LKRSLDIESDTDNRNTTVHLHKSARQNGPSTSRPVAVDPETTIVSKRWETRPLEKDARYRVLVSDETEHSDRGSHAVRNTSMQGQLHKQRDVSIAESPAPNDHQSANDRQRTSELDMSSRMRKPRSIIRVVASPVSDPDVLDSVETKGPLTILDIPIINIKQGSYSEWIPIMLRDQLKRQFNRWNDKNDRWYQSYSLTPLKCINRRVDKINAVCSDESAACQSCEGAGLLCARYETKDVVTVVPLRDGTRVGSQEDMSYWILQ